MPLPENHCSTLFTSGYKRFTEGGWEAFCFEAFCFWLLLWDFCLRLFTFRFWLFDVGGFGRERIAEGKNELLKGEKELLKVDW
jgi:hypothetical protein